MEPSNNWQSWQPKDDDLDSLLQPGFSDHLQQHHPLMKLRKNLYTNSIWNILITVAYLVIIISTPVWQVQLALAITSLFNLVILYQAIQLYRSIPTSITSADSVLSIMKTQHRDITAWCNMQHKLSIWVYPVAATGGYIYGGVLSSGKSFEELFESPMFLWVLPVLVIILVPVGLVLAKWMTKKVFGVHLDNLAQNIHALEV